MGIIKIKIDENFDFILTTTAGNSRTAIAFNPRSINIADKEIISAILIYDFIELFGAFLSNQLIVGTEYKGEYYRSKIVNKNNVHSLAFFFENENKIYYNKYQARVIYRKLNSIINKCLLPEMSGYER